MSSTSSGDEPWDMDLVLKGISQKVEYVSILVFIEYYMENNLQNSQVSKKFTKEQYLF